MEDDDTSFLTVARMEPAVASKLSSDDDAGNDDDDVELTTIGFVMGTVVNIKVQGGLFVDGKIVFDVVSAGGVLVPTIE